MVCDVSGIGGFFKEFELSVIAADERDIVQVRTNVRDERDYLYRIRLPMLEMRSLFLAYIDEANRLVHHPRFYNPVTANCTTLVYHMLKRCRAPARRLPRTVFGIFARIRLQRRRPGQALSARSAALSRLPKRARQEGEWERRFFSPYPPRRAVLELGACKQAPSSAAPAPHRRMWAFRGTPRRSPRCADRQRGPPRNGAH